jgi:hypothetical protein
LKYLTIFLLFISLYIPAQAEKISPPKITEISEQVYQNLNSRVSINHDTFQKTIQASLNKVNVWPDAVVIGLLGRCQYGVGACLGAQANVGYKDGVVHVSVYGMGGLAVGTEAVAKMEVYTGLCYGDCLDSLAQGVFLGVDAGASLGEGVAAFAEAGTDLTALFGWGRKFNWKDLWDYRTVYLGVAFNFGIGLGVSGNLYFYKNLWNTEIGLNDIANFDF